MVKILERKMGPNHTNTLEYLLLALNGQSKPFSSAIILATRTTTRLQTTQQ